jgi:hypothetical protein
MKGIYLTEKGKKEIEDRIKELRYNKQIPIITLEAILEIAVILPVELKWEDVEQQSDDFYRLDEHYPQGVIIQPK